ncbi:aromatic ring-hydroxylating dioxygenase subunit alpha [Aquisediminimonas profunda]|uniref:aromatic ring-hydroxylating dioxygenase subunit alpha n=1 Tax=Aquisediminimonas profunda TaxID=1550733 RepID=UPI001C624EC9|nr:aromatic ring-hydroxylating dioxygenase subunit alpha [Aquisediminimonas profunda]
MLKNAWYVAAWDDEIGASPVERRIIGQLVVLYRRIDGTVAALEGLCPHRRMPLAMGRVDGDFLSCGYHGLAFAPDGQCVNVPCQSGIPDGAHLRSYPVEVRYGLVWIWMGDVAAADRIHIIEIENWGDPAWGYNRGPAMTYECNYLYITDNLLDPSHVAWVHPTSFGDDSCKAQPPQISVDALGVTVSRWIKDAPVAPFYADLVPFAGNADRLQHYEVRYPANAIIKAIFVPSGEGGHTRTADPSNSFVMDSYNFITPETERSSRYYWFQLRNVRPDDAVLSEEMSQSVLSAFSEDLQVLNAVQKGMDACGDSFLSIASDAGPLRFRHLLGKKIAAEADR